MLSYTTIGANDFEYTLAFYDILFAGYLRDPDGNMLCIYHM